MKTKFHSLFYILSLSLFLGGLAGASYHNEAASVFMEPSYDSSFYDNESLDDKDVIAAQAVAFDRQHDASTPVSLSRGSLLFFSVHLPGARAPPQAL